MTRARTFFEGLEGPAVVRPVSPRAHSPEVPADFEAYAACVRGLVESALGPWLERRLADADRRGSDARAVADAVAKLALRGGKRMRPVLLAAAFEGCGGEGGLASVMPAAVSLELLQAYLLVHDDWMDGDEMRRGGPSVPAMMRARFEGARADAMSVLAGDLAAAWARRALLEVTFSPERIMRAAAELARVEEEVVSGQILDVCASAADASEVEKVHALKTASYSVRGPVLIGAHLAGAHPSQIGALAAFAVPAGVAFQLRDDLLGVFGEPAVTGKPVGSDIRSGKRSAVLIEAMQQVDGSGPLARAFGRADASGDEIRAAVAVLEASGVRRRVEGRIAALIETAIAALDRAALTPFGRTLLAEAALVFTRGKAG